MANTAVAINERKTQEDYIIQLLKNADGRKIQGVVLCENLGISQQRKRTIIDGLKLKYPQLRVRRGGKGGLYYWEESDDIPVLENKKPENPSINAEGYFDATAGAAINTVDKEIEKMDALPKFGDVMTAKHANGDISNFFVLWSTDTQATGIYAIECEKVKGRLYKNLVFFDINDKTYRIDTREVCSKPVKYLEQKLFSVAESTKVQVKHRIADILGIKVKEKVVEKIVEKPVEKIVYQDRVVFKDRDDVKVPAGYISRKDADLEDLMHQLAIYKDIVNRLAPLSKEG